MVMMDVLRSSVNEWECDQMGHLNVRHYFARASDGLALMLAELGVGPAQLRKEGLALRAVDQHVRFQHEMRPGTPYIVRAGVVSATTDLLRTYQEILIPPQSHVAATILTDAVFIDVESWARRPFPVQLHSVSHPIRSEIPPHGAARGVPRDPPRPPIARSQAVERGLAGAYLGPVHREDCDEHGLMREAGLMARVSDGMAHFFLSLRPRPRPRDLGGAALEYRFVFRKWPRLGDFLEVRSGLKSIGHKTTNICHFVFDVESGDCIASSEAVAVTFDLATRKSIEIPDDARLEMSQHVIAGIGI
jgi:acyl-CoA thioester hydrolase